MCWRNQLEATCRQPGKEERKKKEEKEEREEKKGKEGTKRHRTKEEQRKVCPAFSRCTLFSFLLVCQCRLVFSLWFMRRMNVTMLVRLF